MEKVAHIFWLFDKVVFFLYLNDFVQNTAKHMRFFKQVPNFMFNN